MKIQSLEIMLAMLATHGWQAQQVSESSASVIIPHADSHYIAVAQFAGGNLTIACQLAKLGDFQEECLAPLSLALLDANDEIAPFAFAINGKGAQHPEGLDEAPIVLIDRLPVEDLSVGELLHSLSRLMAAVSTWNTILDRFNSVDITCSRTTTGVEQPVTA